MAANGAACVVHAVAQTNSHPRSGIKRMKSASAKRACLNDVRDAGSLKSKLCTPRSNGRFQRAGPFATIVTESGVAAATRTEVTRNLLRICGSVPTVLWIFFAWNVQEVGAQLACGFVRTGAAKCKSHDQSTAWQLLNMARK